MRKTMLRLVMIILCFFAAPVHAQWNCNDWVGTWIVNMTDGTTSEWIIDNATDQIKDNQNFIPCRAYGVQKAPGEEDVKFQIVWLNFTNSYQFVPHQTPVTTEDSGKTTELFFTTDKKHFIATLDNNGDSLQHIRSGYLETSDSCIDYDEDGYGDNCATGTDCDDRDSAINPGTEEICDDGLDNNCDGQIDENCRACPAATLLGNDTQRLTTLRKFRDNVLSKSTLGRQVIAVYYNTSEALDAYIKNNPVASRYAEKTIRFIVSIIEKIM